MKGFERGFDIQAAHRALIDFIRHSDQRDAIKAAANVDIRLIDLGEPEISYSDSEQVAWSAGHWSVHYIAGDLHFIAGYNLHERNVAPFYFEDLEIKFVLCEDGYRFVRWWVGGHHVSY